MRSRILRLGAMAAVPALAALGLMAVTTTASASTASPVPPVTRLAGVSPDYLGNHANPLQAVAGDCAEITDNGGHGLSILSHGIGNSVTVEDSGNCFTPVNEKTESYGKAWEYENQSGNCLGVDIDNNSITTSDGCRDGNGFETWIGFHATDASGNSGFVLECIANNNFCLGYTAICADGTIPTTIVNVELLSGTIPDTCVWSAP
jgi:hypothetical protein